MDGSRPHHHRDRQQLRPHPGRLAVAATGEAEVAGSFSEVKVDGNFALAVGAKDVARVLILLCVAIIVAATIGFTLGGCRAKQPESWDVWFAKHQQTCPECGAGPDSAICVEAFEKLQAELRKD